MTDEFKIMATSPSQEHLPNTNELYQHDDMVCDVFVEKGEFMVRFELWNGTKVMRVADLVMQLNQMKKNL
ncbi:MAG: hypothetical protein AAF556_08370 [Pseudomonadota bacterium]